MRSAIATDRAVHNPFQAVPPGGSHHERIAGQGDRGQHRAWVAFRRLDHHVEIIGNVPCGGAERTPGQFPGQLAWHGSGIGDGQAAAAATVMPPATVPGQPEPSRPDGNQPGPPRPRKRHRATQCRHTAGRVIDTHDDPSALTAGIRRQACICHDGCHHLSPSAARVYFTVPGLAMGHQRRSGLPLRDVRPECDRPALRSRSATATGRDPALISRLGCSSLAVRADRPDSADRITDVNRTRHSVRGA